MRLCIEEKIIFGLSVLTSVAVTAGVMLAAYQHAMMPKPEPAPVEDWRPKIPDCPPEVELWDCIRYAED